MILVPAQKEITLDECLLEGIEHHKGGCTYIIKINGNDFFLTLGCSGIYPNLVQGKKRILWEWYSEDIIDDYRYRSEYPDKFLPIEEETKAKILEMKPCMKCGSPWVKG